MKKGTIKLLLISVFVLILLIIVVKSFRSLSSLNSKVKDRESDINVQLNRKKEQIDNICNAYKKYFEENETIAKLEELSAQLKTSVDKDIKEKELVNEQLSKALNQLFEKTTEEILNDQEIVNSIEELLKTEKRLIIAKNNYNDAVEDYNSKVNNIPSSFVAFFRGFKSKERFNTIKINNILEKEE